MNLSFLSIKSVHACACLSCALLLLTACSNKDDDEFKVATDPKQAASQLDDAFANANAQIKGGVDNASAAMRDGDYEKAVVNLQMVRSTESLTVEQGLAIHSSIVSLEGQLIRAAEAGDPNAKRAYELLKAMKRN